MRRTRLVRLAPRRFEPDGTCAARTPHLDRAGIGCCFAVVVGGDHTAKKKPDPAQLVLAVQKLHVPIEWVLMVGDPVNDAQAARAARCPVLLAVRLQRGAAPCSTSTPMA